MAAFQEVIDATLAGRRSEFVEGMPYLEYRDVQAMNFSSLSHGTKSMEHLRYAWELGVKDTPMMQWGRAVHCLLFEPHEFETRYYPWDARRAGKAYEEYYLNAISRGGEVIKATGQYSLESAREASLKVIHDIDVKPLIKQGQAEVAVFYPEGGVQCKGKLDWVSTSEHCITDLKTTVSVAPRKFGLHFESFNYAIQLGLYQRWFNKLTNDYWPVKVIAIESSPPYAVSVMDIPDAVLDMGLRKGLALLRRAKQCMLSGVWDGVERVLETPQWAMDEDDLDKCIWCDTEETED